MAVPDKAKPTTAVRVEPGDTLSAIAKANKTTVAKLLELNPKFTSDPKYKGGNMIFSNTLVNIKPAVKTAVTSPASNIPEVFDPTHLKRTQLLRMTQLLKMIRPLRMIQSQFQVKVLTQTKDQQRVVRALLTQHLLR